MYNISLGMMFYNEETCIEHAIQSFLPFCEEFVAVDMGGSDGSLDIVKKYTTNIYNNSLNNDFAAARNFVKSKCTKKWCFFVDPDEYLMDEDKVKFNSFLKFLFSNRVTADAVRIPRTNWADIGQNKQMQITGIVDAQFKLFRNVPSIKYVNKVHEVLVGFKKCLTVTDFSTQHNQFYKTEDRRNHQNILYSTIK